MKNKYKVELKQTDYFIIDVYAKDEMEAQSLAIDEFNRINVSGTKHYNQVGDTSTDLVYVYNVNETEDPFDPIN